MTSIPSHWQTIKTLSESFQFKNFLWLFSSTDFYYSRSVKQLISNSKMRQATFTWDMPNTPIFVLLRNDRVHSLVIEMAIRAVFTFWFSPKVPSAKSRDATSKFFREKSCHSISSSDQSQITSYFFREIEIIARKF